MVNPRAWMVVALLGGWMLTATAETPDAPPPAVDPMAGIGADANCVHCHINPHPSTTPVPEGSPARFDDCARCHATDHFTPSTFGVTEHAAIDFALNGKHAAVDCANCHVKGQLDGLPNVCAGCHIDRHRGLLGDTCTDCHSERAFKPVQDFDHVRTGFQLIGPHGAATCESCHSGDPGSALRGGAGSDCTTCHQPGHGDLGQSCADCHPLVDGATFARPKVRFDHRETGFELERRHRAQPCGSCHQPDEPTPDTRCASCHESPHRGQLGGQCQDCHRPDRWSLARFDHDLAGWTLRGAHFTAPCTSCHVNQRWIGLPTDCWDCHASDAARAPRSVDAHRFGRSDCGDCHTGWSWRL